jgi:hypothetical protein
MHLERTSSRGGMVAKTLTDGQLVNAIAEMPPHSVAMLYGAEASRSSGVLLASEIVHGREPCTFTNATEVIGMMKELRHDEVLKPNIRYYI